MHSLYAGAPAIAQNQQERIESSLKMQACSALVTQKKQL